jgi:hypothetical protein
MTPDRFDTLLRQLARARSRREMLAVLAAAIAAGAVTRESALAVDATAADCLGRNERCKRKSECCAGRCRRGKGKKRKCGCSPRGAHCVESDDCCKTGNPLVCAAGFCVPDR